MKVFVDDIREIRYIYPYSLEEWTLVRTGEECIKLLQTGVVEELSLDHDLGEGIDGYDVIKWIEKEVYTNNFIPPQKIYCHSANPVGVKQIEMTIKKIKEFSQKTEN